MLKHIFGSIFSGFLRSKPFADEIKTLADKVTLATVEVCAVVTSWSSHVISCVDYHAFERI